MKIKPSFFKIYISFAIALSAIIFSYEIVNRSLNMIEIDAFSLLIVSIVYSSIFGLIAVACLRSVYVLEVSDGIIKYRDKLGRLVLRDLGKVSNVTIKQYYFFHSLNVITENGPFVIFVYFYSDIILENLVYYLMNHNDKKINHT